MSSSGSTLSTQLERTRGFVAQYEEHLAYYRRTIERMENKLGTLDERLGGGRS